jgi:hypothetical protein
MRPLDAPLVVEPSRTAVVRGVAVGCPVVGSSPIGRI